MTSTPIPSPGRTAIEKAAFFIYAASQALWAMAPRDARRFAVASFVIAAIGIAPRLPPIARAFFRITPLVRSNVYIIRYGVDPGTPPFNALGDPTSAEICPRPRCCLRFASDVATT